MSLTTWPELVQRSEQWIDARCGIVTASVVGALITASAPPAEDFACPDCGAEAGGPCLSKARTGPTPIKTIHGARTEVAQASDRPPVLGIADTEASRGLTAALAAERVTGNVEESRMTPDMWRGVEDEPIAREFYAKHHAPVDEMGFMVRDDWGFKIGYSPDGLVGDDGLIEIKSRLQKVQLLTVLDDGIPAANMAQLQAGLLVSGRKWIDYVSYCAGMPLYVKRVTPDPRWVTAILRAVETFEARAGEMTDSYKAATAGLPVTHRPKYTEMVV